MWADVEAMVRQFLLAANLPNVAYIGTDVPRPRPDRFIRLMSGGSARRTLVHRDTRLTVECWDEGGEEAASLLGEQVYQILDEWDLVPDFDGWDSGPYPQPDPDTGCPRYVMTCIVRHRTDAVTPTLSEQTAASDYAAFIP